MNFIALKMLEASTEKIAIATQFPGIVAKTYVQIGCNVNEGNPLFAIDETPRNRSARSKVER
jgi:multidrug resistance efflux pump